MTADPSMESMPFMVAPVVVLVPEPARVTSWKIKAPRLCAPAPLNTTLPNVPVVLVKVPPPLKNEPPVVKVPAPVNVIIEADPADVIFPVVVTKPVEIEIVVFRVPEVLPPNESVVPDKVPVPTLISSGLVGGRGRVIAPEEAKVNPLRSSVVLSAVPLKIKEPDATFPVRVLMSSSILRLKAM